MSNRKWRIKNPQDSNTQSPRSKKPGVHKKQRIDHSTRANLGKKEMKWKPVVKSNNCQPDFVAPHKPKRMAAPYECTYLLDCNKKQHYHRRAMIGANRRQAERKSDVDSKRESKHKNNPLTREQLEAKPCAIDSCNTRHYHIPGMNSSRQVPEEKTLHDPAIDAGAHSENNDPSIPQCCGVRHPPQVAHATYLVSPPSGNVSKLILRIEQIHHLERLNLTPARKKPIPGRPKARSRHTPGHEKKVREVKEPAPEDWKDELDYKHFRPSDLEAPIVRRAPPEDRPPIPPTLPLYQHPIGPQDLYEHRTMLMLIFRKGPTQLSRLRAFLNKMPFVESRLLGQTEESKGLTTSLNPVMTASTRILPFRSKYQFGMKQAQFGAYRFARPGLLRRSVPIQKCVYETTSKGTAVQSNPLTTAGLNFGERGEVFTDLFEYVTQHKNALLTTIFDLSGKQYSSVESMIETIAIGHPSDKFYRGFNSIRTNTLTAIENFLVLRAIEKDRGRAGQRNMQTLFRLRVHGDIKQSTVGPLELAL